MKAAPHHKVEYISRGREPQVQFNRGFPWGKHIPNMEDGASCHVELEPWPTPECGLLYVECEVCGSNAMLTTAGRVDDPRSVDLPCHVKGHA
jgi:hypothetical protein